MCDTLINEIKIFLRLYSDDINHMTNFFLYLLSYYFLFDRNNNHSWNILLTNH